MPIAMKVHSARRAVTYPRERTSYRRLKIGYTTSAVPMFAMMRNTSQTAPRRTRVSPPAPAMNFAGCSTGL